MFEPLEIAGIAIVLGGLGSAAITDWRTREVSDKLWVALAAAGGILGFLQFGLAGPLPAILWIVVAVFVAQHLIPWDEKLERVRPWLPGAVELLFYFGVLVLLVAAAIRWGLGSSTVPPAVLAVYASVVIGRVLFELGILYGGADAKAVMVAGLLVPLDTTPILAVPASATSLLALYPFTLNLIMNAAIVAAAVPIGMAIRNLRRGDFEWRRGFLGYRIPVDELPRRWVWLRDPTFRRETEEEADTSEDDRKLRERQRLELLRLGKTTVWVTPQLPFVVFLTIGALLAVLIGNAVFDLLSLV